MDTVEDCIQNLKAKTAYSLKCLLTLLNQEKCTAESILASLGVSQIHKIFEWLTHRDIELRKISALFICEVANASANSQLILAKTLDFLPIQGKVAINKLPKRIELLLKERPELLDLLRKEEHGQVRYWTFPPLDPNTYHLSLDNIFYFPDPLEYLIGYHSVRFPDTLKEPLSLSQTLYSFIHDEMQSAPFEVVSGIEGSPTRIKTAFKKNRKNRSTPSPRKHYLTPTKAYALKCRDKSPVNQFANLATKRKLLVTKIDKILSPRRK